MSPPIRNAEVARLLSAAPPRPALLRGVSESTALWPLVVVIAILPGLFSLAHRTLTEEAALWNLRAMDVHSATDFAGFVAPGSSASDPENTLAMAPPLASWVSAFSLWTLGRYPSVALALPSYLFGVGTILMTYLLGSLLLSRAAGLLGSLLVAGSAPLLLHVQTPLPHTAAVFTAMVSLFCYAKHLQSEATHYSRWVPLGGVAWGLCLLAGGAFGLVVAATMALHLVCLKLREDVPFRRALRDLAVPWRWPPLVAAWLFWLLGLAVAGWWHLYMWEAYGPSFWKAWWSTPPGGEPQSDFLGTLVPVAPATLALAIAGAARTLKSSMVGERDEDDRVDRSLFMALWVCVATFAAIRMSIHPQLLQLYFVVPLLLLAAETMVGLAQRRWGLESGAVLAVATAAVVGLWATSSVQEALLRLLAGESLDAPDWIRIHLYADLVLLLGIAAWFGYRWCLRSDGRQRLAIAGLLGTVVVFSCLRGLLVTRRTTDDDRQLARLEHVLAAAETKGQVSLVADEGTPELLSTLRSRRPSFPVKTYASWDTWRSGTDFSNAGLVVHWIQRAGSPAILLPEGLTLKPLAAPLPYQGKETIVYEFRPNEPRGIEEAGSIPSTSN